jgi:hypothetical protein
MDGPEIRRDSPSERLVQGSQDTLPGESAKTAAKERTGVISKGQPFDEGLWRNEVIRLRLPPEFKQGRENRTSPVTFDSLPGGYQCGRKPEAPVEGGPLLEQGRANLREMWANAPIPAREMIHRFRGTGLEDPFVVIKPMDEIRLVGSLERPIADAFHPEKDAPILRERTDLDLEKRPPLPQHLGLCEKGSWQRSEYRDRFDSLREEHPDRRLGIGFVHDLETELQTGVERHRMQLIPVPMRPRRLR